MSVLDDVQRRGFAGQRRGIDQRSQPPPTGIRIDLGQLHLGIGDAQQVMQKQQVLGVCVGNAVAHSIASGLPVKPLDARGRAQQPCDGVKGDLVGV